MAARLHPAVRQVLDSRRGSMERWHSAAAAARGRPRIWFHAASAGEALQAQPVVEAIRARLPSAALFASWWSPTAKPVGERWAVDHADFLPTAVPRRMRRLVERIAPDALLLFGAGAWPGIVWPSSDAGARVGQVGCRVGVRSGRVRLPLRRLLREVYRSYDAVAAQSEAEAEWARSLGTPPGIVAVTGDTRVDAAFARLEQVAHDPWPRPTGAGSVLVAGSTHPADEEALLPAIARLRRRHPDLAAFVAPRYLSPETLAGLETRAREVGLTSRRLSESEEPAAITIVDTMGILYRLYAAADVAFVGGAFHGAVHNTMEPAAVGVPVVIGPRPGAFVEVEGLGEAGALRSAGSAEGIEAAIGAWLEDPGAASAAGRAGRAALEQHRGATERTLAFLAARGFPVG